MGLLFYPLFVLVAHFFSVAVFPDYEGVSVGGPASNIDCVGAGRVVVFVVYGHCVFVSFGGRSGRFSARMSVFEVLYK